MADLSKEYAEAIDKFQDGAFDVLVAVVMVALVLCLAGWLSEKLDKIERKYRVKRHIRGPRE